jgi:imidazolonepropionase-like amidohydrolase
MFLSPSRRLIPPLGLQSRSADANQTRAKLHGIKASLLIPGRGEPIKDAAVVIHEDKIDWVGPQSKLPVKYSAIPFARVSYLMPGLWDCHVHYFGVGESDEGGGYAVLASSAARAGARISKDLERTLYAGFTSVREVGGYGGEISPAIQDGSIVGPNIYSSIAPISMTAGHAVCIFLSLFSLIRMSHKFSSTRTSFSFQPDCAYCAVKILARVKLTP